MVVKEWDEEVLLEKLIVLEGRLAVDHGMREGLERDLKIRRAGVSGERSLDYPLQFVTGDVLILKDLRICDAEGYFQIDILVISKGVMIIVEVKNWSGTLLFAENNQVIRMKNRIREGFQSPILQVKLQQHRLRMWLRDRGFAAVPIRYLVVISFPSTILRPASASCSIPEEVIHRNELFSHINRISASYGKVVSVKEMRKIADCLKESHEPPCNDVMKKYNLASADLLMGVSCPKCRILPMRKQRSKWICNACKFVSGTAYIQAIMEYKLLVGDTVTNKQMRKFMRIESRHVMKRLLKKHCISEIGVGKGKKYVL